LKQKEEKVVAHSYLYLRNKKCLCVCVLFISLSECSDKAQYVIYGYGQLRGQWGHCLKSKIRLVFEVCLENK
jgi:hypothetical protein